MRNSRHINNRFVYWQSFTQSAEAIAYAKKLQFFMFASFCTYTRRCVLGSGKVLSELKIHVQFSQFIPKNIIKTC